MVTGVVDVVLVELLLVVVVVDDVVVVAPKVGKVVDGTGTLFGQYFEGYPIWSRGSPTYSKCMPSAGQKFPPQANPHFRKMSTIRQSI